MRRAERQPSVSPLVLDRREVLRRGFMAMGLLAFGGSLVRCSDDEGAMGSGGSGAGPTGGAGGVGTGGSGGAPPSAAMSNIPNLGPLGGPDANGVLLPEGFTSRIVARSGQLVEGSDYTWHGAPDGGATFATEDGGWIYVSNAELTPNGGVGAIRFGADGAIVGAYSLLTGTHRNCAGGPTPWGTWLSCEEVETGLVYECDPLGIAPGVSWPALGVFTHEAAAIDPETGIVYLTEDEPNGRLYRFVPGAMAAGKPDLSQGVLEVAVVADDGSVAWTAVPDPSATDLPTRYQVPTSTSFAGGEGIWFYVTPDQHKIIYFTTKGNNRVWGYDITEGRLYLLYDAILSPMPSLTGVDNIVVSSFGDLLVAEDGGDLQIVVVAPDGSTKPIVQLVGHDDSEIAGPAFSPDGSRLYFSSQRGTTGVSAGGITFEVTGPFVVEA